MRLDSTQETTVELYVRSLTPRGHSQQESAIERLERLSEAGVLSEFAVEVWGRQVDLSGAAARTDAGQFVLDRVEQFREWARRTGRSVDSFFETRSVESSIRDQEYAALVLPELTLAEYRGGELAFVAPCSDGDAVCTVGDRIDDLEARAGNAETAAEPSVGPVAEEAEE